MTLMLEKPAAGKTGQRHHRWTEDEIDIVRRDYRGTNSSAAAIARRLGVSVWGVKGQVQKLGIAAQRSPDWSEREEKLLRDMIERYSAIVIARKMGRSVNAVVVKSKRMGLSRRVRDGWYTMRDVCQVLGVDHHVVGRWIEGGHLTASYHHGHKPQKNGSGAWHIEQRDLRKFIIGHCCELTGRNVDLFSIVHLLSPGEIYPIKETSGRQPIYKEGDDDA